LVAHLRRGPRALGSRRRAPHRPGHAPEEPPRSPDAEEAEGLRGADPPPRRPEPAAARHRRRAPLRLTPSNREGPLAMPSPLVQSTGRRKEAVARVRLRPGNGTITV